MIVPDANLLLYAHDDTSPFFEASRSWWEGCLSGTEPVGLCHPVLFAFVRIATNHRVYANPLPLAEARAQVHRWHERRVTRVLLAGETHHADVLDLLDAAGSAGGNLVTDAQIAAIAIAHGAEVHTADQDFRRFPGLSCTFPLRKDADRP